MTPEELLQQTLEEYPGYSELFSLESATNYLEGSPCGDPQEYFLYCAYFSNL